MAAVAALLATLPKLKPLRAKHVQEIHTANIDSGTNVWNLGPLQATGAAFPGEDRTPPNLRESDDERIDTRLVSAGIEHALMVAEQTRHGILNRTIYGDNRLGPSVDPLSCAVVLASQFLHDFIDEQELTLGSEIAQLLPYPRKRVRGIVSHPRIEKGTGVATVDGHRGQDARRCISPRTSSRCFRRMPRKSATSLAEIISLSKPSRTSLMKVWPRAAIDTRCGGTKPS